MLAAVSPANWAVYAAVVFIWSTTPLAIVYSSDGIDPYLNLSLRILISALLLSLWFFIQRRPFPFYRHALPTHFVVGVIGIGLSMSLVYYAALSLPSSWIALIFGLTPLFTALLEGLVFRSLRITWPHWIGIASAFLGLWLIFHDPDHPLDGSLYVAGFAMLVSTFLHALSATLLKRLPHKQAPIDTVMGGLLFALPVSLLFWLLNGSNTPSEIAQPTLVAITYLAVIGSLAGFLLYYQVLAVFSATMSSFITLLAPTLALFWAAFLNAEPITSHLLLGAVLILIGLIVFILKPADK